MLFGGGGAYFSGLQPHTHTLFNCFSIFSSLRQRGGIAVTLKIHEKDLKKRKKTHACEKTTHKNKWLCSENVCQGQEPNYEICTHYEFANICICTAISFRL